MNPSNRGMPEPEKNDELTEDELDNVAGGAKNETTKATPKPAFRQLPPADQRSIPRDTTKIS